MAKIVVGMSGGVDSAVAAYLLKIAGHDVIGVTLRTWIPGDGKASRCCEIDDAAESASRMGIPYYAVNCLAEFERYVTEPFVRDYLRGRTPNPCTECNRYVKWEGLLRTAEVMGADLVATGHYASVVKLPGGRYTVKSGAFAEKDQAYMLWQLTQEQLSRTIMPLGCLSKAQVREIARKAGLTVADKADSQEICFVPEGNYGDYIEENSPCEIPGGNFVDEAGSVLGTHSGIVRYTVGQRKGLGLALGHPVYVKEIRTEKNEIVIGDERSLMRSAIVCENVNYMAIPDLQEGESIRGMVRVRYHHSGETGMILPAGIGKVRVLFDRPVRAPAPGQSAVFYDGDGCLIGGGVITDSL